MIIFFLIELLYFSSLISTFKKIILKCGQYLLFCLFICFFTLFYSNANVVTRLNLNLYNLVGSFNLFFFKLSVFTKVFFVEIFNLFKSTVHFSNFFQLFNNKMYLSKQQFGLDSFYIYLMLFYKLKQFYKITLINVNLSYIYLQISYKTILSLAYLFKKNLLFTLRGLYDIFTIDYPSRLLRFEIIYSFTSVYKGVRVFLKTHISENLSMLSISNIFNSANWLERECWDLFGVFFANHKNLRRILTDYGFKGFPFRKDFPLTGYIEVRFDDSLFSIVYEPLEISQEFRVFNFKSPWESYEL